MNEESSKTAISDLPVPPGEYLAEVLEVRDMSADDLALKRGGRERELE